MTANSLISVIDDDVDSRDSLRALLTSAGYAVRCYNSASAYLCSDNSAVGCVITDVRMPEMDGMAFLAELTRLETGLPVIMMTGHGDLSLAVNAMKLGAVDFVEKPFLDEDILQKIARALRLGGRSWADREAVRHAQDLIGLLTKRESNVLDQLMAGRSNKVAAFELGISPRTVEIHRGHIMHKMKIRSLSDLVRIALIGVPRYRESQAMPVGGTVTV